MKKSPIEVEQYQKFIRNLNEYSNVKFPTAVDYADISVIGPLGRQLGGTLALSSTNYCSDYSFLVELSDSTCPHIVRTSDTNSIDGLSYKNYKNMTFTPIRMNSEGVNKLAAKERLTDIFNCILVKKFTILRTTHKLIILDEDIATQDEGGLISLLRNFFRVALLIDGTNPFKMEILILNSPDRTQEDTAELLRSTFAAFGKSDDEEKKMFSELYENIQVSLIDTVYTKNSSGVRLKIDHNKLSSLLKQPSDEIYWGKHKLVAPSLSFTKKDLKIIKYLFSDALKCIEDVALAIQQDLYSADSLKKSNFLKIIAIGKKYSHLITAYQSSSYKPEQESMPEQLKGFAALEKLCDKFWQRKTHIKDWKVPLQDYKKYESFYGYFDYFKDALLQLSYISDYFQPDGQRVTIIDKYYTTITLGDVVVILCPILNSQKLIIESFAGVIDNGEKDATKAVLAKTYEQCIKQIVLLYNEALASFPIEEIPEYPLQGRLIKYRLIDYMTNFSDDSTIPLKMAKINYSFRPSPSWDYSTSREVWSNVIFCYFKVLLRDEKHEHDWLYTAIGECFHAGAKGARTYLQKIFNKWAIDFFHVMGNYDQIVECYEDMLEKKTTIKLLKKLAHMHDFYGHYRDASEILQKAFYMTRDVDTRRELAKQIVQAEQKYLALTKSGKDISSVTEGVFPLYDNVDINEFYDDEPGDIGGPTYNMLLGDIATS